MFEELVRGPEPWLYAHVQLPGGHDNIGNPEYDLKNETSLAPRTGTLMRVARYEKQPDNRWAVWVQGLARCRVEKALRNMPYARADIRIIPDGEAFSHFGGTSAFPECWSAALLEDEAFARVEFLPPPESADVAPVCQFDVAAATAWDGDSMEGVYAAPLSVDACVESNFGRPTPPRRRASVAASARWRGDTRHRRDVAPVAASARWRAPTSLVDFYSGDYGLGPGITRRGRGRGPQARHPRRRGLRERRLPGLGYPSEWRPLLRDRGAFDQGQVGRALVVVCKN